MNNHRFKTSWKNNQYLVIYLFFIVVPFFSFGQSEFIHDVETVQKPWTHEEFNNSVDNFQFVIVSDRTGMHRNGVFPEAVRKLNLLQPEFVISVGDLIEGETENKETVIAELDEIEGYIDYFDMPFFYLPGNHDISNKLMADLWRQRFGRSYYYFIYKNVLFLCLDSQDTPDNTYKKTDDPNLSPEQIEWAKNVLLENAGVRWTCVFIHQPLWLYEEGVFDAENRGLKARETGFAEVEQALSGRQFTVFAGHFHNYIKHERNEHNFYVLASTGGGSRMRGVQYGEFDHGAWVTMTDDGPVVANILIDGIIEDDVITSAKLDKIYTEEDFLNNMCVSYNPEKTKLVVEFKNQFNQPLNYKLNWQETESWKVLPLKKYGIMAVGDSVSLSFLVNEKVKGQYVPPECTGTFFAGDEFDIETLLLVGKAFYQVFTPEYSACFSTEKPVIDGKLDDKIYEDLSSLNDYYLSRNGEKPLVKTETYITYDRENLYIATKCYEPKPTAIAANINKHDGTLWNDDSFELFFDINKDSNTYFQLIINSKGVIFDSYKNDLSFEINPIVATGQDSRSWMVELAIPWKNMNTNMPDAGHSWRFHLARNRTQSGELMQLPPLYGDSHQPDMFGNLVFINKSN